MGYEAGCDVHSVSVWAASQMFRRDALCFRPIPYAAQEVVVSVRVEQINTFVLMENAASVQV